MDVSYRTENDAGPYSERDPEYYPGKLTRDAQLKQYKPSLPQSMLLLTDGTVTELLEYFAKEPITVSPLTQTIETSNTHLSLHHQAISATEDSPVLSRQILLQGKLSNKNYLYAESSIALASLPEPFRDDLMISNIPIGKLWSKYRLETYKTDYNACIDQADEALAEHLGIREGGEVFSRTYTVYSRGILSMMITEIFSTKCFA